MSTTYSGVASNVSLATAVQVTIPQDNVDPLAASTVNTPLQKIADYLADIAQCTFTLTFGGVAGSTTATNYVAWVAGYSLAAMGTTLGAVGTFVQVPFAGRIVGVAAMGTTGMAGATCLVVPSVAGADVGVGAGINLTMNLATSGAAIYNSAGAAFTANQVVGVRCKNQTGVSTGLGQVSIVLYMAPA